MAGIGRPKGQRNHNPVKHDAMKFFSAWRSEGHPMIVTAEKAFDLSGGVVDVRGERDTIPLSKVALSTSMAKHGKRV